MTINIGQEQQVQVRGSDGTLLWTQGQEVQCAYYCKNTDTTAMTMGEAVKIDQTLSVIPRMETTAAGASPTADLPMALLKGMLRIGTTGDAGLFGVTLEPVAVGGTGLVAGPGSWVSVQTSATLLTAGVSIGAFTAAGAGKCAVTLRTLAAMLTVGFVWKINQSASPGSGSTGWAGIIVQPS